MGRKTVDVAGEPTAWERNASKDDLRRWAMKLREQLRICEQQRNEASRHDTDTWRKYVELEGFVAAMEAEKRGKSQLAAESEHPQ